jgi:hypothetical protein
LDLNRLPEVFPVCLADGALRYQPKAADTEDDRREKSQNSK